MHVRGMYEMASACEIWYMGMKYGVCWWSKIDAYNGIKCMRECDAIMM